MKKLNLLIPIGIAFFVIGSYIMSYSVKPEMILGRSWMESQTALLQTDYPFGLGLLSMGFTCFAMFVWYYISSKKKSRK